MKNRNCPRYLNCSVPQCPLDPNMDLRDRLPGEPNCPLSKTVRYRLGEGLPMHGLIKREWAAKLNWESKSQRSRDITLSRLRQFSFASRSPN